MEFIFIILSWLILLVPGFDDSVPPTEDKIFKIETSPDIVQSIKTKSDETFDFWGFDIELKQNSSAILDIKIPKNLPIPASFTGSWNYDIKPLVLADGTEIDYDIIEDPCYSHYQIPIEDKTNVEIAYTVILTGTWQLYSPIQFDEDNPCYNKVFYERSIESPYHQLNQDVDPLDIVCSKDRQLVFKSSNSMPACVYLDTVDKLIERNWAQYYPSKIYLEDGRISESDQFLFPQIFEFELKRQGIYYENLEDKEKYRNPGSLPSNPWRACSELIGENGNRFYASMMVIQYIPLITEKVEFDNIRPDHCEKWYYDIK